MIAFSKGDADAAARFAEAVLAAGKIDRQSLQNAQALCADSRERLPGMLARLGLVSEPDIARALAEALDLAMVEPHDLPSAAVPVEGVSSRFLRQMRILPVRAADGRLAVVMADPTDAYAIDALRMATDAAIDIAVAEAGAVGRALDRIYADSPVDAADTSPETAADGDVERLRDQASEAPVIRIVNGLITKAIEMRASDIHIEPFERELTVRLRVDGLLTDVPPPPLTLAAGIVSRIKIMAGLDIAERRRPQDGRIRISAAGRTIDLRVSVVPTMHGESVVLRVLDREGVTLDFTALGIGPAARREIEAVLDRPEGIFLVTGPTGSGKTTTLYAGLTWLNRPERKIVTVEDPIEFQLRGVNQVQVHPSIGLDFAHVLRALLRHDPDVMMVGEIRDGETARTAVQAALTGHLVISTLHTNDAVSAVTRLIDMEVEPFLLASTLSGVAAQRLVRRLCLDCRRAETMPEELASDLGLATGTTHYRPAGCDACNGRGYAGRTVLFEIVRITEPMRDLILTSPGIDALRRQAVKDGLVPLFDDGLAKVLDGTTTVEEVFRTTRGA